MGVTFDETTQQFVFDFEHDGADDIVSLTGKGYQVEAFGRCFYYGYEFADQVNLNKKINLYDYDLVVMPESSSKVNQYMLRYIYRFAQPRLREMKQVLEPDEELSTLVKTDNILVIDDVTTSGSTLNEVLRTLRILNEDNDISIFSLIGRKDLMADAN